MNGRSTRRSPSRSRRRILLRAPGLLIIAALLIIAVLLIVGTIVTSDRFVENATDPATNVAPSPDPPVVGEEGTGADTSTPEGVHRTVYRHSVIAGGVYSARELTTALDTDPVAKDHHKAVALDRVQVKTLSAPRQAYVSYRVGDQVYWTKEKVTLAAGESILTDGNVEIRARCGNGISTRPNTPTADHEPPPPELDEVVDPPTRGFDVRAIPFVFPALEEPPFAGDPSHVEPGAPIDHAGGIPFLPIPFLGGGGGGASSPAASTNQISQTGKELLPILPPPSVEGGNPSGGSGGSGEGGQNRSDDHRYDGDGDPSDGGDEGDQELPPTGPPIAVPEPSTLLLVAVGAMTALAGRLRRRSRRQVQG